MNQYFSPRRRVQLAMDYDTIPVPSSKAEASDFLETLINKTLRVTTTDSRMFCGNFKCTDAESNIILQHVYEYRPPSQQQIIASAAAAAAQAHSIHGGGRLKLGMSSRFLGLVVVPGHHVAKIEVEEFASQLRGVRERRRREQEARLLEEDRKAESQGQSTAIAPAAS
ncbi:hypothetical protein QBC43DRAFT_234389 [Cladorrhinum sp. PSN259]|nr:hypothetical protein QBC43DRAFT_234389 [Cladorrhinum sp. PSN259]